MQKHRSDKAMILGNVHAGGGRSGGREWWERIIMSHVAEHAREFADLRKRGYSGPPMWALRGRIRALGGALRDLRRGSRRWALKQIIRVSEALGLYEE